MDVYVAKEDLISKGCCAPQVAGLLFAAQQREGSELCWSHLTTRNNLVGVEHAVSCLPRIKANTLLTLRTSRGGVIGFVSYSTTKHPSNRVLYVLAAQTHKGSRKGLERLIGRVMDEASSIGASIKITAPTSDVIQHKVLVGLGFKKAAASGHNVTFWLEA